MTRLMNKRQENMEKMLALLLLGYAIALRLGKTCETACLYGLPTHPHERVNLVPHKIGKKWCAIPVCLFFSNRNGDFQPVSGKRLSTVRCNRSLLSFTSLSQLMSEFQILLLTTLPRRIYNQSGQKE